MIISRRRRPSVEMPANGERTTRGRVIGGQALD